MEDSSTRPGRHLLTGMSLVFLAEALILPTGFVTAVFLTRRLGPTDYGQFVLAATVVGWIEVSIGSMLSRATVKSVAEAEDWRAVAVTAVRLYLAAATAAMLLLWLLAGRIAALLDEPALGGHLRLFAVSILLISLASGHQAVLVGLGRFPQRAFARGSRWLARLGLMVLLIELGLSVSGAILGSVGAAAVELAISRWFVRPPLWKPSSFPARRLWGVAAPLSVLALSLRLFDRLDLIALKTLGATAAEAGAYGAALNLTILPGLVGAAFSPLLLSTLSRMLRVGDDAGARELAGHALRAVVLVLPIAGMISGAAPGIVAWVFGPEYRAAGPSLVVLIFGAFAMLLLSAATTVLIAGGKTGWAVRVVAPMSLVAVAGHALLIPRFGATGAAAVATTVAVGGALAATLAAGHLWGVRPQAATLGRTAAVCALAYALARLLPGGGVLLIPKLGAIALIVGLAFWLLGELDRAQLAFLRSAIGARSRGGRRPRAA